MVFAFCKCPCVPAMAVSSLCMLFHEPGVMLAADMQAMQDEAANCQGLTDLSHSNWSYWEACLPQFATSSSECDMMQSCEQHVKSRFLSHQPCLLRSVFRAPNLVCRSSNTACRFDTITQSKSDWRSLKTLSQPCMTVDKKAACMYYVLCYVRTCDSDFGLVSQEVPIDGNHT